MFRYAIFFLVFIGALVAKAEGLANHAAKIPVIYCTDLFHPHDDPDDHFDLACLYAIGEFDIQAIILDQGAKQELKPGRIPVSQLNQLTGRNVPCVIGLSQQLTEPTSTGLAEPRRYQAGVTLILDVLQKSPAPVTIICVGSVRDVAAAYNRQPELFAKKASRLYLFIGDAQGAFQEYNVSLDPVAYSRLMNSGLPIYWVPCFDGGLWKNDNGNASYWKARHAELLRGASAPLMNYFIYALLRESANDPIQFLRESRTEDERQKVLSGERNLWCSAVFAFVANRKFVVRNGRYRAVPEHDLSSDEKAIEIFDFQPVELNVDPAGRESKGDSTSAHRIQRFHIIEQAIYAEAMISITSDLLRELSNQVQARLPDSPR